jgi:hypothetical protein
MIGCCSREGDKFIFENGDIDNERLTKTIGSINPNKFNKDQLEVIIEDVQTCDCPCHIDGATVLC